ncbi:uncharacterized protein LOC110696821 [Chenopodium quinoa]|uniref:uncharacterized protein LOC110696821 n=1 Tax=Chenopodium quinoa TaxID=63459 RepID=UPI000B782191|nr:uncharacterized protein LOC110696821 [Chenopodium quinoa]
MVLDTFGNDPPNMGVGDESHFEEEEPSPQAKKFLNLLKESERPLYEGSTMSVLEMASRTTSLKCKYNFPHRCVDRFASLMNEAIPNNNNMGETFYEVKKVVNGLELPQEKIHACPKGCMLFWKDDVDLSKCKVVELFATKNISHEMTWHAKNPRIANTMAHPCESDAWKHLDKTFPKFASEPRNVRLGLCTDGFAPHVPGPKNPKSNLDVYMQPLIEELKQLWDVGETPYDLSKKQNFTMRAAILWTISDFLAYGMLSGWSTSGKKACPYCLDKSKAFWLDHGGKVSWFDCHRQFLNPNHPFRKSKTAFCKNRVEKGSPLHIMSGLELWECVKDFPKATDGPADLKLLKKAKKVMDVKKQTCDTVSARRDIEKYCRRPELHVVTDERGKESKPKAPFALEKPQRKVLCEWIRELRFPDGYSSNLSRFLNHLKRKIGNKARVEGSICNAYLTEEITNFFSNYYQDGVDTKTRDLSRNANAKVDSNINPNEKIPELFKVDCGRAPNQGRMCCLDTKELERAHLYVLSNSGILDVYEREFVEHILQSRPNMRREDVWQQFEKKFLDWFRDKVLHDKPAKDVLHALSMRPFSRVRTWR